MSYLGIVLLNPLNDLVFRLLMTDQADILKSFLGAVLSPADALRLNDLEISEDVLLSRELVEDKASRLDIKVSTSEGLKIDLEMQRSNQYNIEKRTFFYLSRLYTEGFRQGTNYSILSKAITINLLDFNWSRLEEVHYRFLLWDTRHKRHCMRGVAEVNLIQLPAWRQLAHKDLQDPLHRWLTFMDINQPEEMRKEAAAMDTAIAKAQEKLERLSSDRQARALAQAREDAIRDLNNMLQGAKDEGIREGKKEGKEEGKKEGKEEGKKEGKEEGKKEGKEEGKQEGKQETLQSAVVMLSHRKLGSITSKTESKIMETKDITLLQDILDKIFDLDSEEMLLNMLNHRS